jgi:hypothetical protein
MQQGFLNDSTSSVVASVSDVKWRFSVFNACETIRTVTDRVEIIQTEFFA